MAHDSHPTASGPAGAPCILVVDDVSENRDLLTRRLQSRGYRTIEAAGGMEALERIGHERFDIVLLDMMMPDLDGMQVLRRIREKHSLADLPVIMITAKVQPEDVVGALAADANDYVTKPIDFDVVLARIHTQLRRKQVDEGVRRANHDLERQLDELRGMAGRVPGRDFLADMSHELRTPLNGVIGVADTLAATRLEPRQQEMVRIIGSSAETLERLLSDLLDQARSESGRLEIKGESFELSDAVRSVTDLWATRAAEKGIGFELVMGTEADTVVHGDPVRLKQILTNLLSNAVKFTESGGVKATVERDGERCRFSVSDSGIGFDAAVKERLFARFEQADASISSRFGGTGLGLAISRDLAQLMGGALEAASTPGHGAVFTLELPLPVISRRAAPAPDAAAEGMAEAEGGGPLRVLYAEDHPVNRQVIQLILASAGEDIDLSFAENGAEAVEAFRTGAYELILMDIQMPVMDGLAATREIRRLEAEQGLGRIPIIVVTAHNLSEHLRASVEAGADGHLGKPVNAAQLLSTIAEHGARSRASGVAAAPLKAAG